jgi:hypothetical protein
MCRSVAPKTRKSRNICHEVRAEVNPDDEAGTWIPFLLPQETEHVRRSFLFTFPLGPATLRHSVLNCIFKVIVCRNGYATQIHCLGADVKNMLRLRLLKRRRKPVLLLDLQKIAATAQQATSAFG